MQQPSLGNEEILEASVNQMSLKFQTDVSVMGSVGLCSDPRGNEAVKTHLATGVFPEGSVYQEHQFCLVEPQELWSQFELQAIERKQELLPTAI